MNAKILPLILLLLLVGSTGLQAQNWDQLGPLLELFDQDERNNFENELDGLRDRLLYDSGDGLQVSDLDAGPSIDSLLQYLSGGGIGVPDSLIDVWNGNRGDLDMLLNTGLFSTEDSLALIDQFGVVNGEWYNELDSLQNVITTDFPDVSGSLFNNGDNRFDASGGNWEFAFNCLNDGSLDFRNGITPQGLDSLIEVMDTSLFAGNMDIEIAFGQEWSEVGFYDESYSARSSMIRVASVPTYRETMSYRWALEGSFFTVSDDILSETNASLVENLNPFICNANVAMMYLPYFGDIGRGAGEFRFYTSIGMDLSTYVPAHVDASNARTLNNVGKTTGYGPEIGAGFVVNVGAMSMYSYGTVATGDVIDAPEGYRYNAMTANAGVRFGDAVNAKYTLGRASWAPGNRKTAIYSRFSVGLILDSLNR